MKRRSFMFSTLIAPLYLQYGKAFGRANLFDLIVPPVPVTGLNPPLKFNDPFQPPDETCTLPVIALAPPTRFVQPNSENRLIQILRDGARLGEPDQLMTRSAIAFYIADSPGMTQQKKDQLARDNGLSSPGVVVDEALANAIADLAVSGRNAYSRFKAVQPNEGTVLPEVKKKLGLDVTTDPRLIAPARPSVTMPGAPQRPAPPANRPQTASLADINACVKKALDRAYQVAEALRGPYMKAAAARQPLGWIAVSGEDDPPHRPVNAPPLPYPQYEIPVTFRGLTLNTRFYVASANAPAAPVSPFAGNTPSSRIAVKPGMQVNGDVFFTRSVPVDEKPIVPQGHKVILFLHGHSSSAEEAAAIIPALLEAGKARGVYYSVVTFDLPNNGYSTKFDHLAQPGMHSSDTTLGYPINAPVLDFIEEFIVAFVDQLDRVTPIINRFAGTIGGSLGGNMGLRLGRRDLNRYPWLKAGIVSWDPASVWTPFTNDVFKTVAVKKAKEHWDQVETPTQRAQYFVDVYETAIFWLVGGLPPQPQMWYRDGWKCKDRYIMESRTSRREIYHEHYRRWHWRVAGEQLLYSHQDHVVSGNGSTPVRYLMNRAPQLLAAGEKDNYQFSNIYDATREVAKKMVNTPGTTLFLKETGHSIHCERPRFFAEKIVEFLS